jgi:hypothetical protein
LKQLNEFEQELTRINDEYQREKQEVDAAVLGEDLGSKRGPEEFKSLMTMLMNLEGNPVSGLEARWLRTENILHLGNSQARFEYFTAGTDGQPQARVIISKSKPYDSRPQPLILRPRVSADGRFYWISSGRDNKEMSTEGAAAVVLRSLVDLEKPGRTSDTPRVR